MEDKTIDELELEYAKEVKKRTEFLKLENEKRVKEFNDANPPVSKIPTTGEAAIGEDRSYTGEDYHEDWDFVAKAMTPKYGLEMFEFTDSDAACPTIYTSWTPSEYFSNFVLHGIAKDCPLIDLVKMKVNVGAEKGTSVRFRTIGARTAQGDLGGCECMSCVSPSLSYTDVTIGRFGDFAILCEFESWSSKDVKKQTAQAMSLAAARFVNKEIYDAISEATPGYNEDLAATLTCSASISGSCCSDSNGYNLYIAAVDLIAAMNNAGYNIDQDGAWIMNPTIAAFFKYPSDLDVPYWMRGSTEVKNGKLTKLLGIPVYECPHAPTCSTVTDTVFAYLVSKKRSIGLAWGQRPKFTSIYDVQCDSWNVGYNAYFGVDSIEDASIGTISSPDA